MCVCVWGGGRRPSGSSVRLQPSVSPLQLVLEYERGVWNLRLGSTEEVDEVIAHVGSCLQRICPSGSPV